MKRRHVGDAFPQRENSLLFDVSWKTHRIYKVRRHVLDTQLFTNCLCDSSPLSLGFLICKRGIQKLIYLVVVKIIIYKYIHNKVMNKIL